MNDDIYRPSLRVEFIGRCVIVALGAMWFIGLTFDLIPPPLIALLFVFLPMWIVMWLIACFILKAIADVFGGGR